MNKVKPSLLDFLDYSTTPFNIIDVDCRVELLSKNLYISPGSEKREPWECKIPIDWQSNPFKDSDWRYQLNGWRIIEPLLVCYEKKRDPQLIKQAILYIDDWKKFNIDENKVNQYKWYDASTALRALKLTYLLYLNNREINLNNYELSLIKNLSEIHLHHLSYKKISSNNHAFFQLHAAMALSRVMNKKYLIEKIKQSFFKTIVNQYGNDGVHTEHSPGYHFYVYEKIRNLIDTGWYGTIPGFHELEKKILQNAAWFIDANNQIIEVGDTSKHLRKVNYIPLQKCQNNKIKNYGSRFFKNTGYAIVRSLPPTPRAEESLLFFSGSFHSKTHKHADDLAILWMEKGHYILSDTGKYNYGDGQKRLYTRSSQAHNTITADNISTSIESRFSYGSSLKNLSINEYGWYDLFGKVWHRGNNFFHARRLLYNPGKFLIVLDRVKNKTSSKRSFATWFHFPSKTKIIMGKIIRIKIENNLKVSLAQSTDLIDSVRDRERERESYLVKGKKIPIQGWYADDFHNLKPRPSLNFSGSGQNGTFVHVFSLIEDPEIKYKNNIFYIKVGSNFKCNVRSLTSIKIQVDQ